MRMKCIIQLDCVEESSRSSLRWTEEIVRAMRIVGACVHEDRRVLRVIDLTRPHDLSGMGPTG